MRERIGLAAALALLSATGATAGEAAIGELIGLTPVEVRARLTGAPAATPLTRGFEVARDGGTDAYFTLDDLAADPAALRRRAAWRTHGEVSSDAGAPVCRSRVVAEPRDLTVGDPVLAFRDGRLTAVLRPARPGLRPPAPPHENRKAYERWIRQASLGPFQARFGQLPLEDGVGFLGRWEAARLDGSDRLLVDCAPPPALPAVVRPAKRPPLNESDMQGLALAPFAIRLPAINRDRARARDRGAATLAGLSVGQRLPRDVGLHARRDGLRWHGSARPGYGVLTVDLGGGKTRNLSDMRDAALVGVEDGVVRWISPPGGAGPGAGLLCVDAEGLAGTPRPGCQGWGIYRP
ncbi:hypothetical protein CFHF_03060 [Caulobacter flavus]|uniref:Uncharacterized protein n=1 Tax=Caulobacter flavus TaxID=1679497 RepID=A0A2N5CYX2_9CAUL|nr:hypothetical protein [Caulobacter flavus]AYV45317.1 hypothetical protein C1707_03115 [Caulobacter flavus]PLR19004.1 hypothetical protein CFHF_03060 [Caulobacter flavus]